MRTAPWKDPWCLAQTNHVFIATSIVWGLSALAASPWWVGLLGVGCWIVPKEFGFDIWWERDTLCGSCVDAAFYVAGGGLAALALWLKG